PANLDGLGIGEADGWRVCSAILMPSPSQICCNFLSKRFRFESRFLTVPRLTPRWGELKAPPSTSGRCHVHQELGCRRASAPSNETDRRAAGAERRGRRPRGGTSAPCRGS